MSVIAKLYVQGTTPMGSNTLLALSCVCENELMAGHTPSNEDILFSKYSPSGEARLILAGAGAGDYGVLQGDQFYFIFQKSAEQPNLDGAFGASRMNVQSITDFGGTSKQVQLVSENRTAPDPSWTIQNVNFKIMIDNPRASDQFKAGESGWWLTVYKATSVTMHEAIAMAHAVKETAGEEEKV